MRTIFRGTSLYRLYFRGGDHPVGWGQFRHFGPLPMSRFDHHRPPPSEQSRGILYAAEGPEWLTTILAEVFQTLRLIDLVSGSAWIAGFALARDVRVLDLGSTWTTYATASTAINTGRRDRARRWSRAIYEQYPDIEGLAYPSSMNANQPALALFERAADAIPGSPIEHYALSDPVLRAEIEESAGRLGYDVRGVDAP